jgi:hypothetical protein
MTRGLHHSGRGQCQEWAEARCKDSPWDMSPASVLPSNAGPFCFSYFSGRVLHFLSRAGQDLNPFHLCLLNSWGYRCEPWCLVPSPTFPSPSQQPMGLAWLLVGPYI